MTKVWDVVWKPYEHCQIDSGKRMTKQPHQEALIAKPSRSIMVFVDGENLALFVEMWLVEDVLLSEDINRNGLVNFSDWAEFAGQWLWEE